MPIGMLPGVNYVGMTREQVFENAILTDRNDGKTDLVIECYDTDREIALINGRGERTGVFKPGAYAPQRLSFKTDIPVAEDACTPTEREILNHTSRWDLNFRYRMAFWGVGYHYCIEVEFDANGRVSKQAKVRRHFL